MWWEELSLLTHLFLSFFLMAGADAYINGRGAPTILCGSPFTPPYPPQ